MAQSGLPQTSVVGIDRAVALASRSDRIVPPTCAAPSSIMRLSPVKYSEPGAGRKPGRVSAAKRQLSDIAKNHAEAAMETLVDVHKDTEAPHSARVSAATAILDRAYGKPAQSHEHAGHGGGPISTMDLTKFSDADLDRLEAIFGPLTGAAGDDDGPEI